MNTGTCLRPSCTAIVCPSIAGTIMERRDHVLMTFRVPFSFWPSTFLSRWSSTKGPFFRLRGIIRCSYRFFLPRLRMISRSLGLFSDRVRPSGLPQGLTGWRPPELLPSPPPSGWSTGFMATPRTEGRLPLHRLRPALPSLMLPCSEFPTSPTVARQLASTRRISPEGIRSWAYPLSFASSCTLEPADLAILAQRQAVPRADVGARAVLHPVSLPQPLRAEDVALLAVGVVQQRDARGAVRVVLHVRDLGGHAVLVRAAEVDQPVGALVTAALVPGGDPAVHIPPAPGVDRADERLLRLAAGDLGEVRAARAPPARGRRLVLTDGHVCSSSCRVRGLGDRPAKDVDPLAGRQRHDGPLGVGALAPAVPGAAALARPVDRVDGGDPHPEDLLDRLPDLGLVGLGSNQEGVLAVVHQPVTLLRDHRLDQDIPWISDLAHCCSSFAAPLPEEADLREVPELRCLTTGGAASPSAPSAD